MHGMNDLQRPMLPRDHEATAFWTVYESRT